ncbi:MAG: radical SAM protein [Candidatus Omnitrophica bacterium]|nr:radical SAM protein [Candidatus Omnitrophota bacterium]
MISNSESLYDARPVASVGEVGLTTDSEGRRKVSGLLQSAVFGPVDSRRFGRSLGVNPLPPGMKICSFDCPYCECGPTSRGIVQSLDRAPLAWPRVEDILQCVLEAIESEMELGRRVDAITLAGNGEPTLHPEFHSLMKGLSGLRRVQNPAPKLIVLTNGSTLGRAPVRFALELADEACFKLDAGTFRLQKCMNRPILNFELEDYVEEIAHFPDPIVQSLFVRGRIDNTTKEEVDSWIERLEIVSPRRVDIYSLDRLSPDSTLTRVHLKTLNDIAGRVRDEVGVHTVVY